MKKDLNYITTLPDFIEMQRTSFCWFLSQGLTDELGNFSSILDFSGNIEYVFFGQEYKLVKPIYNAVSAKRYATNYVAQLLLPIEMRSKITNTTIRQGRLPIANLPLMTTSATFIINGCERIIVSQVIRSPGIYFEKNKKQKKRKFTKLTLSNDFHKVRGFTQTTFGILKNPDLSSLSIIIKNIKFINQISDKRKVDPNWYFVEFFKIYQNILNTLNPEFKIKKIKKFLKWIRITNNKSQNPLHEIKNYNLLFIALIKYAFLQNLTKYSSTVNFNEYFVQTNKLIPQKISKLDKIVQIYKEQILPNLITDHLNIYTIYNSEIKAKYKKVWKKRIYKYYLIIQIYKNNIQSLFLKNWIFLFSPTSEKLENLNNFNFLKIHLNKSFQKNSEIINLFNESKNLKVIIYLPLIKKYRRSDIIKNKDFFEKKDFYKEKYIEKDFYTATLIPEYGSWIRFTFQRDKRIDNYKYPITNRLEDDIIIQIDKLTKKPVIHLLREMGLTDLEICQNLQHADFFYFNLPFLISSIVYNYPLLRFNINNYYKNISEFSRIFDNRYYRLGRVGRYKINNYLNLKLSSQLHSLVYEDIFAIIDYLITLSVSKTAGDDIDHLKNRRVRSVGELMQHLFRIGFQRLSRKILSQVYTASAPPAVRKPVNHAESHALVVQQQQQQDAVVFAGDEQGQDALEKLCAAGAGRLEVNRAQKEKEAALLQSVCQTLEEQSRKSVEQTQALPVSRPHLGALAWPAARAHDNMSIACTDWAPEVSEDANAAWQRMSHESRDTCTKAWCEENTLWADAHAKDFDIAIPKRMACCFYAGFCVCCRPKLQAYVSALQKTCRMAVKKGTELQPVLLNNLIVLHIRSMSKQQSVDLWLHISHADRSVWRVALRRMSRDTDEVRQLRASGLGRVALVGISTPNGYQGIGNWWATLRDVDLRKPQVLDI